MWQCCNALLQVLLFKPNGGDGWPASGHDRCVGMPWHPYAGRGPTGQAARAPRPPRSQPLVPHSIFAPLLPLCARRGGGVGGHCRCSFALLMHHCHRAIAQNPLHRASPSPSLASLPLHGTYHRKVRAYLAITPPQPCAGPRRSLRPPWSG
jgi:hypothetical protein